MLSHGYFDFKNDSNFFTHKNELGNPHLRNACLFENKKIKKASRNEWV